MKKFSYLLFLVLFLFVLQGCKDGEIISEFNIEFDTQGGNEIDDMIINLSNLDITLPIPVKDGYSFLYWSIEVDGDESIDLSSLDFSSESIKLYAKWEQQVFNLRFSDYDGTILHEESISYGDFLEDSYLDTPVREGYTFNGWDIDLPNKMPAEDVHATATYLINRYRVNFETYDGETMDPIEQDYQTAFTVDDPLLTGYAFLGWYLDEAFEVPFTEFVIPASDITLYAKYERASFNLIFSDEDGTILHQESILYDEFLEDTYLDTPIKEGYTFNGWDIDLPNKMPAEDVHATATYLINRYHVNFETYDGNPINPIEQDYQTPFTVDDPLLTGYAFLGWYLDEAFELPFTEFIIPAQDITLYAKYERITYTIEFEGNGGTYFLPIHHYYMDQIQLPIPQREGFIFDGWYLEIDLINLYQSETMPAENLYLYAKWIAIEYHVYYVLDGGTNHENNPSIINGLEEVPLYDPTKEGFTFMGWYFIQSFLGAPIQSIQSGITSDIFLYAKWQANQYSLTYVMINEPVTEDYAILYPNEEITDIASTEMYSMFLTSDHRVFSYGMHLITELGTTNYPVDITSYFPLLEGEDITEIYAGGTHAAAYTSMNRLLMFGNNEYGQVTLGSGIYNAPVPVDVTDRFNFYPTETIDLISLGYAHTIITTTHGRIFTFGQNYYGQLGFPQTYYNANRTPVEITLSFELDTQKLEHFKHVFASEFYSLVVTSENRVFVFGDNGFGGLGLGNEFATYETPTDITHLFSFNENEEVVTAKIVSHSGILITSDNRIFTWGDNGSGQLGLGYYGITKEIVTEVTTNLNLDLDEMLIDASTGYMSMVLTSKGRIFMTGYKDILVGLATPSRDQIMFTEYTEYFDLDENEIITKLSHSTAVARSIITSKGRLLSWGQTYYLGMGDHPSWIISYPQESNIVHITFLRTVTLDVLESIEPYNLELEGYIFNGWYTDLSLTIPFDLTNMPGNDLMVYGYYDVIAPD